MPGSQDFSNAYLPQQPINSFLFPRLDTREQINFVTNPHKFEMSNIDFIGTSGQNLHDVSLYSRLADPTAIGHMKYLLEARHLCPTAPDTLRCFPFRDGDPFVINKAPDVFFAGC